jgi:hypothetical protein
MFGKTDRPTIRIAVSSEPGARLLLDRLAADWTVLGVKVQSAEPGVPVDLKLIDAVAPSTCSSAPPTRD